MAKTPVVNNIHNDDSGRWVALAVVAVVVIGVVAFVVIVVIVGLIVFGIVALVVVLALDQRRRRSEEQAAVAIYQATYAPTYILNGAPVWTNQPPASVLRQLQLVAAKASQPVIQAEVEQVRAGGEHE